jgi:hypothetical protein
MRKRTRAISTLLMVLLILLAAIIGALIAYMWAIAPFYFEPQNTMDLVITDASFLVDHADQFNVTVMNPSHSITDTSIISIFITSGGYNGSGVTSTSPELPFTLKRGTSQTFTCSLQWGSLFAGSLIAVHVLTANNTEAGLTIQTQSVSLSVSTSFDATRSTGYFNMSVTNNPSVIDLNLSSVLINNSPVDNNLSITLPAVIPANQTISFACFANWADLVKPTITVQTTEGYTAETTPDVPSVDLQVTGVTFNETNSNETDIALFNSPDSAAPVTITNITLAHGSTTDVINGSLSTPALPTEIGLNQTVVFACAWNWTDMSYRNVSVAVTAYTLQGFVSQTATVTTPPEVAAKINDVRFDLGNTGVFVVNMTNMAYSLRTINVTEVDFNQNVTSMNATLITPDDQYNLACFFDWSGFVGQSVNLTAHITYDSNELLLTYNLTLPYLKITNASFYYLSPGGPYVNVTVLNSKFSKINATITQVYAQTENGTVFIATAAGQEVPVGSEVGIVCPWNWEPYTGQDVTLTIETADGRQTSATFKVG